MKHLSLALLAALAVTGYLHAQTPAPAAPPAQAAAPAAPAASSGGSVTRACKEQVKSLCGRAHGDEMQNCVKSNIDMNKFSADCKAELSKPKPAS
jgi:invasion protein IalB